MTFTPADLDTVRRAVAAVWIGGHAYDLPSDAQAECEARVLAEVAVRLSSDRAPDDLGAFAYTVARQIVAGFYRQNDAESWVRQTSEGPAERRDSEVIAAVRAHGTVTAAAKSLGISRQAIHKHLRRRKVRSGDL